jgi:hypothetical protein
MPIATSTAIALGVAAAASTAQTVSGAVRTSRARKALENFQRQELRNVTEGMRISTLGAELQTQEAQRRFATSVDALRAGGVRGLVGGLGAVEQQQQAAQQQIAAGLDVQQQRIEQIRAQDEANVRAMQEQRESSQIAGLGAEMAAGRQQVQAGLQGIGQTAIATATSMESFGQQSGEGVGDVVSGIQSGQDVSAGIAGLNQNQALRAINRLDRQGYNVNPIPQYGSIFPTATFPSMSFIAPRTTPVNPK